MAGKWEATQFEVCTFSTVVSTTVWDVQLKYHIYIFDYDKCTMMRWDIMIQSLCSNKSF